MLILQCVHDQKALSSMQDTKVIDTWFSVDTRPFKQALLTVVKKWSLMFKQHLIDHVTNRQVFWGEGVGFLVSIWSVLRGKLPHLMHLD